MTGLIGRGISDGHRQGSLTLLTSPIGIRSVAQLHLTKSISDLNQYGVTFVRTFHVRF
jgi:hypothetical protein